MTPKRFSIILQFTNGFRKYLFFTSHDVQAKIIRHLVLAKHYNLTLLCSMFVIMATAWLDQSQNLSVRQITYMHFRTDSLIYKQNRYVFYNAVP